MTSFASWLIIFVLIAAGGNAQSAAPMENRSELETELKSILENNYLAKKCSLEDNDTWISIELKGKTWRNPMDTRSLVDTVFSILQDHLPLCNSGGIFKIYIDEPVSGFPVAEMTVKGDIVQPLNYTYHQYKAEGKKKIYPAAPASKAQITNYDAIIRVPNTNAVLIAVDERAYDAFTKAAARSDYDLLTQLLASGQLIETANNIKVKIVKHGVLKHKVKVLEGMNTGSTGWIASEFVKK